LSLEVAQNELKQSKSRKKEIVAISRLTKGFSFVLDSESAIYFSGPPVSTAHPLLHF
jgi:hypothetical protein